MTTLSAFGLDENGLVSIPETEYRVCQSVLEPLEKLTAVAKSAGFSLRIESAYRSFERQLSIWNRKATGKLTLRDAQGVPFPELPQDEEILTPSAPDNSVNGVEVKPVVRQEARTPAKKTKAPEQPDLFGGF